VDSVAALAVAILAVAMAAADSVPVGATAALAAAALVEAALAAGVGLATTEQRIQADDGPKSISRHLMVKRIPCRGSTNVRRTFMAWGRWRTSRSGWHLCTSRAQR
jgi:hypothetical protein